MKRSSLNHVYRVVWNAALQVWQVVSEVTKGRGKTKSARAASPTTTLAQLLAAGALVFSGGLAYAELPQGGHIAAGSGTIESNATNMVVRQNTDRVAIDWQQFNIGEGNNVQFIQPSANSVALNRVLGGDPSQIRGSLIANGRLFLVNPSGIVFGERSVVDVAGIVASTLNISNEDFMAGRFNFEGASSNAIINKGNVVAQQGGFVVLIAAKIENVGRLNANGGAVLLGAGQRVRLDLGGPVKIEVDGPVVDAYIKNSGIIQADGGNVMLTVKAAEQLASLAINNSGVIQARGIGTGEGGTIRLSASGQGAVENSGTIDASSERGKGGQVDISAAAITLSAGSVIDASGATAGGTVKIDAPAVRLDNQSRIDVSQKAAPAFASPAVVHPAASVELDQPQGGTVRIEAAQIVMTGAAIDATGEVAGGLIAITSPDQNIASTVLDVSGGLVGGRIRAQAPVEQPELPRQPQPQAPTPVPTSIVVSNSVLRSDSENGEGGDIELTADDLQLLDDNTVSASGAMGGGNIKLGGGYQGNDSSIGNALRTLISAGTLIQASATVHGNGGEVIVWADDFTLFEGHIEAKGGALGGDGGFAEVSGKDTLAFRGTVDLTAAMGKVGTLLLDPTDITITASDLNVTNTSGSITSTASGASTLSVSTLLAALSNSNVVVTTNGSPNTGSEVGTITVASALSYNSPYKLTLTTASAGGVVINTGINITNTGFGGFEVNAGTAGIQLDNSIITFAGGTVVHNSNGAINGTGPITTTAPLDSGVASGQVRFVSAGDINFTGLITTTGNDNKLGQASSAGQVIVSSTGGSVLLGNIVSIGGNNTFNPSNPGEFGGSGGQGGAVQISAGGSALAHTIQVGDITTQGGIGKEGVGGGGGTIAITTRGTNTGAEANQIIVGAMITTGGANTQGGFNGGNAGNIIIQAARVADDSIRLQGDIAAVGGASTAPSPQGLGGNIRFKSAVKIDTAANALSIDTGNTNGDITFESTTDSYDADIAESLTITAGVGNVFFQNDVGLGASESKELNSLTVTAQTITANRSITARGGVTFTATSGIVLGDSAIPSQSAVINTNRLSGTRGQGPITLSAGSGTTRLFADLTMTRGTGAITISAGSPSAITATMNAGDTRGRNYNITVNGTGSTANNNGHVTISSSSSASILDAGDISLSKIGNLALTGYVTAQSLIYQDAGTGTVTLNRTSTTGSTFSDSATPPSYSHVTAPAVFQNAGAHGLYINTAGAITVSINNTLLSEGARASLISTTGLLHFNDVSHSNLTTTNGMVYLEGVGITQANASSSLIPTVNAGNQRIIVDGRGAAISLGGRLTTTNNDKVDPTSDIEVASPSINPAILIRNASSVLLTGVSNSTNGTLQIGTPKSSTVTTPDVTGDVTQRSVTGVGINVKTISAYTGGDISITSNQNNFDHTGNIELGGKLNIQSDLGGLGLLGDITATQVRLATGGGALALGTHNVTTTPVPGTPPVGAGDGSITLIGLGVTQSSGSIVNAGASTIEINGRDVSSFGTSNINLGGSIVTTNATASAVRIYHSTETNSTIKVGTVTATFGQVTLGTAATTLAGSNSRSGAISQYEDNTDATIIIDAKDFLVEGRSSITLNNNNKLTNLLGVRYGGAVDIKDMDGLLLTGSIAVFSGTGHQLVKLETAATGGTGAALLNVNGQNITGNGITLLGQGAMVGDPAVLSGGVQSSGGTLNATNGAVLINAGDGFIDLSGTTILTDSSSATAVQLLNTGVGGNVVLGNIRGWTANASIGTLVLGGAATDNIQGAITQSTGTTITAAAITGNTTGSVTLDGANLIRSENTIGAFGELKAFTAGGAFVLNNAATQGLRVTGAVVASNASNNANISITLAAEQLLVSSSGSLTGDGVSLWTKTGNGYITLSGNVAGRAGTITLTADGSISSGARNISINQTAGSITTTGLLTGQANREVLLTRTTNSVADLGPFSWLGDFELNNTAQTGELRIVGNMTTTAGKLDITSGGAITQTAGLINTTDLRIIAGDAAVLGSATNTIGNLLTANTQGDFTLYDSTGGLTFNGKTTFNGDVSASNNGTVTITTLGGALNIGDNSITATGTGDVILSGVGITTLISSNINGGSGKISLDGGGSAVQLAGDLITTHNTDDSVTIKDASSVSLSNVTTGTAGTLTLGVSNGDEGVGAATQVVNTKIVTGTLSGYAQRSNARAPITLANSDNDFTKVGYITSETLSLYSKNTNGITWVGDVNATGTTTVTSLGKIDLDTYNLIATGNTLNLNGVDVIQSTETRMGAANPSTIEAASTNVQAGSGVINLLSANNDFSGTVTLSATGADAAIRDRNALALASIIRRTGDLGLAGETGITAIAGTTLQLAQEAITKTGSGKVDLQALGGEFQTSNTITTANGNINITQASTTDSQGLSINHALTSTSGNITLSGNRVVHSNAGSLSTGGTGLIGVTATRAAAGTGDVTMVSGMTYAAGTGGVEVNAQNNIVLTSVTTTGNVSMNSNAGAIRDALNTSALNITGNLVTLTASTGVGQSASNNQDINLSANTLVLTTNTVGTFITNDKAVTLGDSNAVGAGQGEIKILTSGDLSLKANGTINTAKAISAVGNGSVHLETTGANQDISFGSDVTMSGGSLSLKTANGNVDQTAGAISTAGITVDAGGDVALAQVGNDFTGAVVVKATGNVSLRDANDIDLGRIDLTTGSLTVQAVGITQSAAITQAASAGAVSFDGGAGAITLNDADNELTGAVSLNNSGAHNVSITDTTSIVLGASNVGTGTLTVNAVGITQTGAVVQAAAAGLATFNAGGASINLNNANNEFVTVSAISSSGGIIVYEKDGFAVHTLNAGASNALTLQSGGAVTTAAGQGLVTAGTLSATTLNNAGASVSLTNAANDVAVINLKSLNAAGDSNATGTITFVDANGFVVDGLQTTGSAVLTASAAVTQTGVAVVGALALKGPGSFVLNDADNQVSTLASDATGVVYVVSSTATSIGAVNPTGVVTGNADFALKAASIAINESINAGTGRVYLQTTDNATGTITQASEKGISAAGLAIKSVGNVTLLDATNNVTNLATDIASDKTLSYRDVDGINIAILNDVGATGNSVSGLTSLGGSAAVSLNVGGLLTQDNAAVINLAGSLTIDATRFDAGDVSIKNTNVSGTTLGNTFVGGAFSLDSAGAITQFDSTYLRVGGDFTAANNNFTAGVNSNNSIGIGESATLSANEIRLKGVITLTQTGSSLVGSSNVGGVNPITINLAGATDQTISVVSISGADTIIQPAVGNAVVLNQNNLIAGTLQITTKGEFVSGGAAAATGIQAKDTSLNISNNVFFNVQQSTANTQTSMISGIGVINLSNSNNSFFGTISARADGMAISISDNSAMTLGNITGSTVTLSSGSGSHAITQSGIITATNLLVSGAGAVSLGGANKVGTVATGSVAGFNFANAQALTVGTVSGTNGITSTGPVVLASDGLTVSQAIDAGTQTVTLNPYTAATAINFGGTPSAAGQLNLSAADMARITAGHLIVGSSDAGAITVGAITLSSDLTLFNNANISVAGALNVGAKNLVINTSGMVTQSAAITAAGLGLLGSGTFTLTNAGNSVTTLAGGTSAQQIGALTFVNAGALIVRSVNPDGIDATGAVDISTVTGDLTVNENIRGSSVVLNAGKAAVADTAAGGNVIISGTPTITATSGNVRIYTGSIAGSTGVTTLVGAGSGRFRYNGDETTTYAGVGAIGATGAYAIYRERPTIVVTPGTASTPYGDTPSLTGVTASYSGLVNEDTATDAAITGTAAYTTTATSTSNAGSYDIAYSTGLLSAIGYAFVDNTDSVDEYTVAQRVISLSGSRIYNRLETVEAAALDDFGNVVQVQTLTLTGVGSVANKTVGDNKAVTLVTLALGNGTGLASNYTLEGGTHTLTITPKAIFASGITAQDKEYDGNNQATLVTTGAGFAGLITGDLVTLDASGVFADENVSYANGVVIAKTVTTTGPLTLSGADAGNYTIEGTEGTITAKITPRIVTLSASKEYDGSIDLTGSQVTIGRLVGNEKLTYSAATVNDTNVLTADKFIHAITLVNGDDGGLASNYALPTLNATSAPVTITAKALTATLANQTKVYNGNTGVLMLSANFGLNGFVNTEGASIKDTNGSFNSKDVLTATTVTVTLASDDFAPQAGTVLSNYVLPTTVSNTTSTITPKSLSLTLNGLTKTYDGNNEFAVGSSDYVLDGFIGAERTTLSNASALFNSQNVWEANTASLNVTSDNYVASANTGMVLSNYSLPTAAALANAATFSVTPKTVQLSAAKVYDGSTDLTGRVTIVSGIGTETLNYADAQSSSKDVAVQNKFISDILLEDGTGINGGDKRNYQLPELNAANAAVTINPFVVSFSGTRTYNGTNQAQASDLILGTLVPNETLGISGVGTLGSKHVANNKTVTIAGLNLVDGTGLESNYTLTGGTHQLSVTPASLTITISDVIKTYDATTSAQGTAVVASNSGTQLFESDTLFGGSFAFDNKHVSRDETTRAVLSNKSVTVSGVTVNDGNDGLNYQVTYLENTTSRIDPATLQVLGLVALDKVYDGTRIANLSTNSATLSGVIAGDQVNATRATGTFADKNVSYGGSQNIIDKAVTADTIFLEGDDADNYTMAQVTGLSAKITPLGIRPSVTALDREYNATRVATVVPNLVLPFAGDDVEIDYDQGSALFEDSSAGLNKFVSVSGIRMTGGADSGNYVLLTDTAVTFADIFPRRLTITADNKTRAFAASDPVLTFTQSGLVNGENINVRFDVPRGPAVTVGSYNITPFGVLNPNYDITYINGTLTITPISQPFDFSAQRTLPDLPAPSANQMNVNSPMKMPLSESFAGGQFNSTRMSIGNLQLIDISASTQPTFGQMDVGQISESVIDQAVAQVATSLRQGVQTRVLSVDGGIKLED